MTRRRPVLLVHGAFRGGWAWQRVRAGLLDAGFDVHAPSLVGCGERHGEVPHVLDLDTWVSQLERLVLSEDLHDVVVVSHSQGGIVTRPLALRLPGRVSLLVHVDAALTEAGERAVDLGPGVPPALPPREHWVQPRALEPRPGMDEDLCAWVNERLRPTPMGPSLDVVREVDVPVREVVLFCAGTPDGYPSRWSRERCDAGGVEYELLPCGHEAPLEAPELVVDAVIRAARDASGVGDRALAGGAGG